MLKNRGSRIAAGPQARGGRHEGNACPALGISGFFLEQVQSHGALRLSGQQNNATNSTGKPQAALL